MYTRLSEPSWQLPVGVEDGAAALENSLAVPQRSDKEFPRDPAIPLPRIYPGELKTYVLAKAYMRTFTAALFAIAKKCN